VITDFGSSGLDDAFAVAIQSDGKIVVAGYATVGTQSWGVARYNSDGSLDTSFDTDGMLTTDFGGSINESARGSPSSPTARSSRQDTRLSAATPTCRGPL
jgi:uncharacterized delta-60 repeat protein